MHDACPVGCTADKFSRTSSTTLSTKRCIAAAWMTLDKAGGRPHCIRSNIFPSQHPRRCQFNNPLKKTFPLRNPIGIPCGGGGRKARDSNSSATRGIEPLFGFEEKPGKRSLPHPGPLIKFILEPKHSLSFHIKKNFHACPFQTNRFPVVFCSDASTPMGCGARQSPIAGAARNCHFDKCAFFWSVNRID